MNELALTVCPRPNNLLNQIQMAAASAASVEKTTPAVNDDACSHDPPAIVVDRQQLSPNELGELREACNELSRQVSRAAQIQEELRHHRDADKKRKKGKKQRAKKSPQQTRPSKSEPRLLNARDREWAKDPPPYNRAPVHAAAGFRNTASQKIPLSMQGADVTDSDPLGLIRMPSRMQPRSQGGPVHQPARISTNVGRRPVTAAAASGDHPDRSNSTSRTGTTWDQPSTRLSSWSSPADERKSSPGSHRVSDRMVLLDRPSTCAAGVAAKTWRMQELAHRRPETISGRTTGPGSRGSTSYKPTGTDRPGSRAGTIAGSVKDTIRDYIRPRPSSDTTHIAPPIRSENRFRGAHGQAGPECQGSGNRWWRGSATGSRRTWSSFRNDKSDGEGPGPSGTEGSANLNRELPALPGLDQYREKKPNVTHVAQLMRAERGPMRTTSTLPGEPRDGSPDAMHRHLIESERTRHAEAVHRAMEERMRHHTRMASATIGLFAQEKELAARKRATAAASAALAAISVHDVPTVPAAPSRKRGLRDRLSRIWHRGGPKGMQGENRELRKTVAAQ